MKKDFLKIVSAFCIAILFVTFVFNLSVFADDSVAISSKEDLELIRNDLSGSYYLTCDITFTEEDFSSGGDFYNSGKGFIPIGSSKKPFTGTLDGKGYTIYGLKSVISGKMYTISHSSYDSVSTVSDDGWTGDYVIGGSTANVSQTVGLIGLNKGEVKNISVCDFNLKGVSTNGVDVYIGGVVGYNVGLVSGCSASGKIISSSSGSCGTVVGYNNCGMVENCYSRGEFDVKGKYGGVVATIRKGYVQNCYTVSNGSESVISNIVNASETSVTGCYYISSVNKSGVGTQILPENAKNPSFFEGFDFENIWKIGDYQVPMLVVSNSSKLAIARTGDVNADGALNLTDVSLLAQCVAKWEIDIDLDAANISRDFDEEGSNIITLTDVSLLAQYVAKWNVELF